MQTNETQWEKDHRRAYDHVLAHTGLALGATTAARFYANTVADIRGQLVYRELDGEWDWEAGPFCSSDSFPSQAAAAADFEATIFDLVGE